MLMALALRVTRPIQLRPPSNQDMQPIYCLKWPTINHSLLPICSCHLHVSHAFVLNWPGNSVLINLKYDWHLLCVGDALQTRFILRVLFRMRWNYSITEKKHVFLITRCNAFQEPWHFNSKGTFIRVSNESDCEWSNDLVLMCMEVSRKWLYGGSRIEVDMP